jgi:hypothetical protein
VYDARLPLDKLAKHESRRKARARRAVDNARSTRLTQFLGAHLRAPQRRTLDHTYVALDVLPHVYVLRTLSNGEVDGAGAFV